MSEFKPRHNTFWDQNSVRNICQLSAAAVQVLTFSLVLGRGLNRSLLAQEMIPNWDLQHDIPEEVLQTEVILQGRSPINGEKLTPSEYAQLQDQLQVSRDEVPATLAPQIHRSVVLLRLRKIVITLFPFLK